MCRSSNTAPPRNQRDGIARPIVRLLIEPDRRRPGWFVARVEGGAEILVKSRQPLADSARALLERGFDPATLLTMRHAGFTDAIDAQTWVSIAGDSFKPAPIGEWARWTYWEGEKRTLQRARWMPRAGMAGGQKSISAGIAGLVPHPVAGSFAAGGRR